MLRWVWSFNVAEPSKFKSHFSLSGICPATKVSWGSVHFDTFQNICQVPDLWFVCEVDFQALDFLLISRGVDRKWYWPQLYPLEQGNGEKHSSFPLSVLFRYLLDAVLRPNQLPRRPHLSLCIWQFDLLGRWPKMESTSYILFCGKFKLHSTKSPVQQIIINAFLFSHSLIIF